MEMNNFRKGKEHMCQFIKDEIIGIIKVKDEVKSCFMLIL